MLDVLNLNVKDDNSFHLWLLFSHFRFPKDSSPMRELAVRREGFVAPENSLL